jgi:hypothetical protein
MDVLLPDEAQEIAVSRYETLYAMQSIPDLITSALAELEFDLEDCDFDLVESIGEFLIAAHEAPEHRDALNDALHTWLAVFRDVDERDAR